VAIPDSPLLPRFLGAFLALPGSTLVTGNGVDCRIRILVLLVTLAVAFAAILPDLELAPAVFCLIQRVCPLVSFAHRPNPSPLLQAVGVGGVPSAISSGAHNCIIELTCCGGNRLRHVQTRLHSEPG
jgi:hypothetical protein